MNVVCRVIVFLTVLGFGAPISAKEFEVLAYDQLLRSVQQDYRRGNFSKAFATLMWARKTQWSQWNDSRKDHWLALELMGLARHCQWAVIDEVAGAVASSQGVLVKQAMALIRLKKQYARFQRDADGLGKGFVERIVERQILWQANEIDFSKIKSPERLRLQVRSLCAET